MEFIIFIRRASHLDKETALASVADSILSKLDQEEKKATAKLWKDKVGQSFKIPASQKSLSYILGLQAENGCPIVTEEPRVTTHTARCPCH